MRAITLGAAIAALALAGCATREPAPVVPAPPPEIAPPAPPPSPPPPQDWRDIALTPGDWAYRPETTGSSARFGA